MALSRCEIFGGLVHIGGDSFLARLPVDRTDLSVLVCELKPLHQSQHFVHVSADCCVVYTDMPNDSLLVHYEQTSKRHSFLFDQHPVSVCRYIKKLI